jgi:hypothetical protein
MNKEQKNCSFFDDFGNINSTNRLSIFSISKRVCLLLLFLFSSFFLNLEAKNIQQIPSSKLKVVVAANASKTNPNKAKARTTKKKVKKPTAAPKDTAREIDPANTNSPLFEKNQI